MSRRPRANTVAVAVGVLVALFAVLLGGAPARAAVADVWAFAFMDNPAPPPDWVMDEDYQAGTFRRTCKDWATVSSPSAGVYDVRFPCSASTDGIAHVTAVDASGRFCTVGDWTSSLKAQVVRVYCFEPSGVSANARFTVLFTTSSGQSATGAHGYVSATAAGAASASFNSSGAANTVTRLRPGVYEVALPGLAQRPTTGNVQATAVHATGTARRCRVADWSGANADHGFLVFCTDFAGTFVDAAFTLSYHDGRAVYGAAGQAAHAHILLASGAPPSTNANSLSGPNTVVPGVVGTWDVTFPRVAVGVASHMQVTAFGGASVYCQLSDLWALSGLDDILANTVCFGPGGVPANGWFFATYAASS